MAAIITGDTKKAEPALTCERKFVSDRVPASSVVAVLSAWCIPDGQYPIGELESIYFDDTLLSSYREKINGDALKRKVRIRWYRNGRKSASGLVPSFLELKDRIGAARDKARFCFEAPVDDLEDRPLCDPWYAELLREQAARAGFAISPQLVPSVAIRYRRHRFVCPVTLSRISVDYCVVCTRGNSALFNCPQRFSDMRLGLTICEGKSPTVRSWPFSGSLAQLGMRLESFSKYGYFIDRILQGGLT